MSFDFEWLFGFLFALLTALVPLLQTWFGGAA